MRAAGFAAMIAAVVVMAGPSRAAATGADDVAAAIGVRALDGAGNNVAHPDWGQVGKPYLRVTPAVYADGVGAPVPGPPTRYISNRIFADYSQNLFSENGVTQWGFVWGQLVDHTIGLREGGGERAPIAFSTSDPLETFRNDFGAIDFSRSPAAPGTGVAGLAREQINTVSSLIDAWAIYGGTDQRLEWLREGPVNGDLSDNGAKLVLDPGGLLPRRSSRGNTATAPVMELQGALGAFPQKAMVAGDVRANENIALTATQTLFAREHNRIVDALPVGLSQELKFQIARRIVSAEEQYITYSEFLPSLGVRLPAYRGYDPTVNPTLTNEFAVVGYRAHSMIHGEIEPSAPAGTYTAAELEAFEDDGIEVEEDDDVTELAIPLNLAFGNPDLLARVGVGPVLNALSAESEYRNDEMIDNQLRSVLFQVPRPGIPNPAVCLDGLPLPDCYSGVSDLGALDIERGRDHGMPSYNRLRQAYGLAPNPSFTAITGEDTDQFPDDPLIDPVHPIDDPDILDLVALRDLTGRTIALDSPLANVTAVTGVRRTTLAARLRAIYGNVGAVDAFTGMVAEKHVPGTEFGELQLAIWKQQFQALRDGDRFYYANDPAVTLIEREYGISPRRSLARIIEDNTEIDVPDDVFKITDAPVYDLHDGGIGATVSATLSLTLGASPSFGTFLPGLAKDYLTSTTANVISTAGDAVLTVADPSPRATGHLVNGTSSLPQTLQAGGLPVGGSASPTPLRAWSAPVSNEVVPVAFKQPVAANDALRTGGYSKTLTYTLSTTTP